MSGITFTRKFNLSLCYIYIFLSSGAVLSLFARGANTTAADAEDIPLLSQVIGIVMYCTAAIAVFLKRGALAYGVTHGKAFIIFALLAILSCTWSIDPSISARRSLAVMGTLVVSIYVAQCMDPNEFFLAVRRVLSVTALASLLIALLTPTLGIHDDLHAGLWRGAYLHKNQLGLRMAICFAMWSIDLLTVRRLTAFAWCVFTGVLLVMSGSRGGFTVAIIAVAVILTTFFASPRVPISLIALAVSVAGILVTADDDVLYFGGTEQTLTGRVSLWSNAIRYGMQRPLLGYGYRAFWTSDPELGWKASSGHNVLLDLWLDLGVPGVLIVAWIFALALHRLWWPSPRMPLRLQMWNSALFISLLVAGFIESMLYQYFIWLILAVLAMHLRTGGGAPCEPSVPSDTHRHQADASRHDGTETPNRQLETVAG